MKKKVIAFGDKEIKKFIQKINVIFKEKLKLFLDFKAIKTLQLKKKQDLNNPLKSTLPDLI